MPDFPKKNDYKKFLDFGYRSNTFSHCAIAGIYHFEQVVALIGHIF
jgi:hypothetical protein